MENLDKIRTQTSETYFLKCVLVIWEQTRKKLKGKNSKR